MEPTRQYDKVSLRRELIRDEGMRFQVYRDSLGYRTIGVGHLLRRNEKYERITQEIAMELLDRDIEDAEHKLTVMYPDWRTVDEVRQRALLNLTFNLGYKLNHFKALAAMKAGDWASAATLLGKTLWYRQVKSRGPRILHMIRTGLSWLGT